MGKKLNSDKSIHSNLHCCSVTRRNIMDYCGAVVKKRAFINYIIEWWFASNSSPEQTVLGYLNKYEKDGSSDNLASIPCSVSNKNRLKEFCGRALSMSWLTDQIILDFIAKNVKEDLLKKVLDYDKRSN